MKPTADELFECVQPFCGVGAERVMTSNPNRENSCSWAAVDLYLELHTKTEEHQLSL